MNQLDKLINTKQYFFENYSDIDVVNNILVDHILMAIGGRYCSGGIVLKEGRTVPLARIITSTNDESLKDIDPISYNIGQLANNYTNIIKDIYKKNEINIIDINNYNKELFHGDMSGIIRTNQNYVYNHVKKQIKYIPPEAKSVQTLYEQLISYINNTDDGVDKAIISHIGLVQIHPYHDGNGRVSRVILDGLLYKYFNFFFPFSISRIGNSSKYIETYNYNEKTKNLWWKNIKIGIEIYKELKGLVEDLIKINISNLPFYLSKEKLTEVIEKFIKSPIIASRNIKEYREYREYIDYLESKHIVKKTFSTIYGNKLFYMCESSLQIWITAERRLVKEFKS